MAEEEKSVEDLALEYTQARRKEFIEALRKDNKIPDEKADRSLYLAALSDMDKVSISKLRIRVDEKQGNMAAQAAALIAKVLTTHGATSVFTSKTPTDREVPVLDSAIPHPELVPGELDARPAALDIASFMANEGKQ